MDEIKREPDECFMICSRVEDGPANVPSADNGVCGKCGCALWLAPSSKPILERHTKLHGVTPTTVCFTCAKKCGVDGPPKDFKPEPEQLGEILKHLVENGGKW